MKNTTHSNSVGSVRPSRNRCSTGMPASRGSCTTNCVAGANAAFGLIDAEQFGDALVGPPGEREEAHRFRQPPAPGSAPAAAARRRRPQTPSASRIAGSAHAASKPPSAAPTEKPQNMIITMVARRRCGLNSEVIATAFGIAPPRPSPVRKRIASSVLTSLMKAVASVPMPNASVEKMMIFLRPIRSASGPNTSAPIIRPNRPALNTGPSARFGQAPFLGQRRRHIADGLGVEAVEKQHRRAGQQQLDLKSADRLLVDISGDIDACAATRRLHCLRTRHGRLSPQNA